MKKLVPDPPLADCATVETSVGHCPEHPDIFAIRPGVSAEDALVHTQLLLKGATVTCTRMIEDCSAASLEMAQITQHLLELSTGLVDALLDGLHK